MQLSSLTMYTHSHDCNFTLLWIQQYIELLLSLHTISLCGNVPMEYKWWGVFDSWLMNLGQVQMWLLVSSSVKFD